MLGGRGRWGREEDDSSGLMVLVVVVGDSLGWGISGEGELGVGVVVLLLEVSSIAVAAGGIAGC